MDIFLDVGQSRLKIPLLPNKITVKRGTMSTSFQVINGGEHKIPRGTQVTGYSWQGVFPGEGMSGLGFVKHWRDPKSLVEQILSWQENKDKISLLITDSCIKDTVFIDSFTYEYQGKENINYTINLSAYRKLTVTTAPPQPKIKIPVENPAAQPAAQATSKGKYTPPKDNGKGDKDGESDTLSATVPTSAIASLIDFGVKVYNTVAKPVIDTVSSFFNLNGGKKSGGG